MNYIFPIATNEYYITAKKTATEATLIHSHLKDNWMVSAKV
jgi:hypothetical protein